MHSSSGSSSLDHSAYKTLWTTCPKAYCYIPDDVNFCMQYKPWKMRILFWHLPQNPYLSSCLLHPCTSTYNTGTKDLQLGCLKSVSPAVYCLAAYIFSISSDDTSLSPAHIQSYHLLVQHVHQSTWCGDHNVDTPVNITMQAIQSTLQVRCIVPNSKYQTHQTLLTMTMDTLPLYASTDKPLYHSSAVSYWTLCHSDNLMYQLLQHNKISANCPHSQRTYLI